MKYLRVLPLLLSMLPALAYAQSADERGKANTKGLIISPAFNFTSIEISDFGGESESGPGGSLLVGYGLANKFAFFFEGATANIGGDVNDYQLRHYDLGARISFWKQTRKLMPFVDIAATKRFLKIIDAHLTAGNNLPAYDGDLDVSGLGFTFGGGLHYYFHPKLAVTGGVKWTNGEFGKVKLGNTSFDNLALDGTSRRFTIGMTWVPK